MAISSLTCSSTKKTVNWLAAQWRIHSRKSFFHSDKMNGTNFDWKNRTPNQALETVPLDDKSLYNVDEKNGVMMRIEKLEKFEKDVLDLRNLTPNQAVETMPSDDKNVLRIEKLEQEFLDMKKLAPNHSSEPISFEDKSCISFDEKNSIMMRIEKLEIMENAVLELGKLLNNIWKDLDGRVEKLVAITKTLIDSVKGYERMGSDLVTMHNTLEHRVEEVHNTLEHHVEELRKMLVSDFDESQNHLEKRIDDIDDQLMIVECKIDDGISGFQVGEVPGRRRRRPG